MSKDPAVLFYTSDYLTGTRLFNYEQKGRYTDLLFLQHQTGHIEENDFKTISNNDPKIEIKFKKDNHGKYYNQRMDEEIEKRKLFTESRRYSAMKRWDKINKPLSEKKIDSMRVHYIRNASAMRMGNENENVNKDENTIEKRLISFKKSVNLCTQYPEEMRIEFIDYWTEKNKSETKMRFELEKTWDINKRLIRWANNNKQFSKIKVSDNGTDRSFELYPKCS
jgi:hypothetical protein